MNNRDKTKYIVNDGKKLPKNRFVLEVVKIYLNNHKSTFSTLNNVFLREYQGSTGVINKLDYVLSKYANHNNKRHFLNSNEILMSSDNIKFVVSTEWNKDNVKNIVKIAEQEGIDIIQV